MLSEYSLLSSLLLSAHGDTIAYFFKDSSLNASYHAKHVTDLIIFFNLNNEEEIIPPV